MPDRILREDGGLLLRESGGAFLREDAAGAVGISARARAALYRQETDEVLLCLVTISHPDLPQTIRFVNNTVDIVSRGETYIAYPFQVELPDEDPEHPPAVEISIDAIRPEDPDLDPVAIVRSLTTAPTFTFEVVLASTPNQVEITAGEIDLLSVDYDAMTLTGRLEYANTLSRPFASHSLSPSYFPGLFQQ